MRPIPGPLSRLGGGAVFQRDNLFLPISSFPFFNQSVIGAIRVTHFLVWRATFHAFQTNPQIREVAAILDFENNRIYFSETIAYCLSWILIGYYPYLRPILLASTDRDTRWQLDGRHRDDSRCTVIASGIVLSKVCVLDLRIVSLECPQKMFQKKNDCGTSLIARLYFVRVCFFPFSSRID